MARKLMLVDRYHIIEEGIRSLLQSESVEVASFDDGLTALDMLSSIDPDLVIADYEMQGISIPRFCEKLQKRSVTKTRPLLLLADPAEPIDQERLRAGGVTEFIKKPVEFQGLIEKIKEYLPPAPVSAPAPAQKTEERQGLSQDQLDSLKIEKLLGWSVPAGKTVAGQSTSTPETKTPIQEDDRTVIEPMPVSGARPVSGPDFPSSEPVPSELSTEPPKTEPVPEAPQTSSTEAMEDLGDAISASQTQVAPSEPIIETEPPVKTSIEEGVSTPTVEPAASTLPPQVLEDSVSKMAKEIIEKVAWEVVPALAEALIKEEIEKLKSDQPK